MVGSIRTFDIGILFGYIGYYKIGVLGNCKAFASNSNHTVLIETTDNKKMINTPGDPAMFVESLNNKLKKKSVRFVR